MASALVQLIPRIVDSQQPFQIIIKSRELLTALVKEGSLAPTLIKNAYRPMYQTPYGVSRVTSSIFSSKPEPSVDTASQSQPSA